MVVDQQALADWYLNFIMHFVVFLPARYLFEGLGHLLSSILISNLAHIRRINMNGIKKM